MKKLKIISTLCLFLFLVTGLKAQITKVEIQATGLTCSMCSNAIAKQLESIAEVTEVETDLNTSTFIVTLSDSNALTPAIFKQKVEKAGFFVGSFIVFAQKSILLDDSYILVGNQPVSDSLIKFQILDKGYVTQKAFKTLSKTLKKVETYNNGNENDFHIKILD